ncbi:MAG: hypothetical protein AAF557_03100 [Pseudomonadota bacterium]
MWAQKISDAIVIPSDFGIGEFPTEWSEPLHYAEPGPPLKIALIEKTQSALHAIFSGVMIWAARRLGYVTDVTALEDIAVMLFCYQQDPDYVCQVHPPSILESSQAERYEGVALFLEHLILYQLWKNDWRWPLLPHYNTVAQAITLIRYQMGPKQRSSFDSWITRIIERMNDLGPLPEHKGLMPRVAQEDRPARRQVVMGLPIPPQSLDLGMDMNGFDMSAAWHDFLTTVDFRNNRFLKPLEDVQLSSGERPYFDSR